MINMRERERLGVTIEPILAKGIGVPSVVIIGSKDIEVKKKNLETYDEKHQSPRSM